VFIQSLAGSVQQHGVEGGARIKTAASDTSSSSLFQQEKEEGVETNTSALNKSTVRVNREINNPCRTIVENIDNYSRHLLAKSR
jgi:hypothetical protein